MHPTTTPSPLKPYRALDLTNEKGLFCGRLLADLGVDVIKIEKPGGDPSRRLGPFYHDIPNPETSLYWLCYSANKRGVTLDLESKEGREIFRRLLARSHFVIESFDPGYLASLGLDYPSLCQSKSDIILTSITPFGQTGPRSHFKGSDLVCWSAGGYAWIAGYPDSPPVQVSFPQAYLHASAEASVATLIANFHRLRTGQGQHVDVSIQACVARDLMNAPLFWEVNGVIQKRSGPYRVGLTVGAKQRLHWKCKDGYVTYLMMGGAVGARDNRNLVEYMDNESACPQFMKDIKWKEFDLSTTSQELLYQFEKAIGAFFASHTMQELYQEAIKRRMTIYPVATVKEIIEDPQLEARGFWESVEDGQFGSVKYPGSPARLSKTPCIKRTEAPHVGQHNRDIFCNELGYSEKELREFASAGVI